MSEECGLVKTHPIGEREEGAAEALEKKSSLNTLTGKVHLR
jgi:hypothetical protein